LCFFPGTGSAQELKDSVIQISEVKITADPIFKKETAGMKAHKVDTLILDQKLNHSLSDLLSENTPVFIKSYGRGALATASFRGTAASHTLVDWNGLNMNSPMLGMADFSLIPVFLIDELDLKYGSASVQDNNGGFGGSITIGNKPNWNKNFEIKNILTLGSYKTVSEMIGLTLGRKKLQSKTRLYLNYSENDFTFINRGIGILDSLTGTLTNPIDTNKNADYRQYGLLQEFYYRPTLRHMLSLKLWSQFSDRTVPRATSYEGPDNANLNEQADNDHKWVLDWKRYGQKGKLYLFTAFSYRDLLYKQMNRVTGSGDQTSVYSQSQLITNRNQISYEYRINPGFTLDGSISYQRDYVQTSDSVLKTGYNENKEEVSGRLSIQKNVKDRLNINVIIRQNMIDRKTVPLIPFLGIELKPFKKFDLLVKGNIGRNYHYPSLNDLYWQPGGNPDLTAEKGISYEAGLEFQKIFDDHSLKSELTLYESDIKDWIIWIPSYKGYWEARNIEHVHAEGLEYFLSLKGKFNQITYAFNGNYAFSRSVNLGDPEVWGDDSYGKQLVYVPLHSGNVMIKLGYKKFSLAWQHNSYGERFTTSSNDVTKRDWLYPYFMNDLSFGREFKLKKTELTAEFKIYNLFNEVYHTVLYRPMPKRNYTILLLIKI
jgi:iron complex outermembrane receptor protein